MESERTSSSSQPEARATSRSRTGWNDADGAAYRAKIEVLFSKTGDTETLLELRRLWKVEDAARRYLSECLPHPCPDLALRAHYREKLRKAME
jgi:hypothetical protein